MKKLLVLVPSLKGGGTEKVVLTLLRNFDRSEFALSLAVVDASDAVFAADLPGDVRFFDLDAGRVRYALPKLVRLIRTVRPDIVISTLGHLNLALAMLRPFLPRQTRFVARESSIVSMAIQSYKLPGLWAFAFRKLYKRFDLVVCQSRYMQNDLCKNYGIPAKKTTVINNPLEIERIRALARKMPIEGVEKPERAINFVAAGRLSPVKGFDVLIDALAICADPAMRLTILGEGPMREMLSRRAIEKGVSAQVNFAGFQSNPYPYFAGADAFVLSSRYEGFPNVVLEALACGTPVVAVPAPGGVVEIVADIPECILADDLSANALAHAMLAMKRSRVPENTVAPYAVQTIVEQYQQVVATR